MFLDHVSDSWKFQGIFHLEWLVGKFDHACEQGLFLSMNPMAMDGMRYSLVQVKEDIDHDATRENSGWMPAYISVKRELDHWHEVQVALAGVMYYFWWDKHLGIEEPVKLGPRQWRSAIFPTPIKYYVEPIQSLVCPLQSSLSQFLDCSRTVLLRSGFQGRKFTPKSHFSNTILRADFFKQILTCNVSN